MSRPDLSVTVVITTKNRRVELESAIRSALAQSYPTEVVVIDDGSMDGTSELVSREFPDVVLVRHAESRGLIVRRNEGARIARGDIIVSIDDDAVFSEPNIVADCMRLFRFDHVAAVAIPYVDVNKGDLVKQRAPNDDEVWVTGRFIGTAHALRRDVFRKLGGYRESLVHQGEESDYCIRLLDAGWAIALGRGAPIHHFESPLRDFSRMDYYGPRNAILFVYQNVPLPFAVWRVFATAARVALWTLEFGRMRTRLRGILDAFRLFSKLRRDPVTRETYRLFQSLDKTGPVLLDGIARRLAVRLCHGAPEKA